MNAVDTFVYWYALTGAGVVFAINTGAIFFMRANRSYVRGTLTFFWRIALLFELAALALVGFQLLNRVLFGFGDTLPGIVLRVILLGVLIGALILPGLLGALLVNDKRRESNGRTEE